MNYLERIHKLQATLKDFSVDALLVQDKISLYYLTGIDMSAGTFLIHSKGACLLVDNRYIEQCQESSPIPVLLTDKLTLAQLLETPEYAYITSLGFDSCTISYKGYKALEERLKNKRLVPLENPLKMLRGIKNQEEIAVMRKAARLGSEGYDYVCTLLKEGISEIDIAIELEIFWKRKGSKGLAFEPIIAFGPHSSMPHYRAGNTKLKKGEPVLIDIGVNLQHYHSDMSRVVFFGEPSAQMREIYEIVLQAQLAALDLCRPGTFIGDLDDAARDIIGSKGYGDKFSHKLGHGVGLEIHEWPIISNTPPIKEFPLQSGMVLTIEPGIYLPGIGGVRIEDTVVITPEGHENLTQRNKDLRIIS